VPKVQSTRRISWTITVNAKGAIIFTEDLAEQDEKQLVLLNSLCSKDLWTFEEADKVRDLCRAQKKKRYLAYEQEERADRIFDKLTQEMKNAATQCGLVDTWDWYDSARDRLAKSEGVVSDIRRILGRLNPEAMFREFGELFVDITIRVQGITKWGYDSKLVVSEYKKARRLISKERDNKCDKERDKDLQAMQAFIRAERLERK